MQHTGPGGCPEASFHGLQGSQDLANVSQPVFVPHPGQQETGPQQTLRYIRWRVVSECESVGILQVIGPAEGQQQGNAGVSLVVPVLVTLVPGDGVQQGGHRPEGAFGQQDGLPEQPPSLARDPGVGVGREPDGGLGVRRVTIPGPAGRQPQACRGSQLP